MFPGDNINRFHSFTLVTYVGKHTIEALSLYILRVCVFIIISGDFGDSDDFGDTGDSDNSGDSNIRTRTLSI